MVRRNEPRSKSFVVRRSSFAWGPSITVQTRLSRICDAIIEAGWLVALIVTPLFFNTFSNRVFEPDKLHLLRSIALVMAVAWLVQLLDGGFARQAEGTWRQRVRATPLAWPVLILVLSYLLSTALSVAPRISFLGSYVRMQGTWSYLSYVVIFAMVLTHMRSRSQVRRVSHAIILTSLPIAIYGILQKLELDPLPWGGDVIERVAANMGNSIFVAAYLIIAVFLTLERLLDSMAALFNAEEGGVADALRAGAYLFVLPVQLIAIVFTQSRGPWIGLAAGLYVFVMLGLLLLARWAAGRTGAPDLLRWFGRHVRGVWLALIGVILLTGVLLVTLNLPQTPLKGVCKTRYVSRLCTLFSTTEGTNAVRALIWEGVVDMMLKPHAPIQWPDGQADSLNAIRPLIGYGPESMWVAYNRFYPPDLAHYEARNASPDRSHNETFDTLVRGGLFQFAAQIFLYASVFYYALRWLGLMRGRGRRNLFVALLAAGGMLGVIVPLIFDHSLRLAGIGLPAGLLLGMIVYVSADLLLSRRSDIEAAPDAHVVRGGRRQLLIVALFAAIVAHFMEIHLGIAIAATLTHFWVLAGMLVAVGMGWTEGESEAKAETEVKAETPAIKPAAQPARSQSTPARVAPSNRQTARPQTTTSQPKTAKGARPDGRSQPAAQAARGQTAARQRALAPWLAVLPYILVGAVIALTLTWDFIPYGVPTGAKTAGAFFWDAFTTRSGGAGAAAIDSPGLLVMLLFTWLVGGLLVVAEATRGRRWLPAAGLYFAAVIGTWLVYGLIEAGRMTRTDLTGLAVFRFMAGHIVVFDILLLVLMLGLAAALALTDRRPRPARFFGRMPALSLGAGVAAAALAVLAIINVNIQTVQADTYYKHGLSYESANQWEGAVILYGEAARLEPQEDYYYLFLGRALLQLTELLPAGNAILPADLNNVATADLLGIADRGARAGDYEDAFRASHAALTAAQRLNPLNTDHSANLARLDRAWAFANALSAGDSATNQRLREILKTKPNTVDTARLQQSVTYYKQATALSPNNAGLWNELANVQYIQDDLAGAQESISRSLMLDQRFPATYLIQGDILAAQGDTTGALAAYRQANKLAPGDLSTLSAIGVFAAQSGDAQSSIDAFNQIITKATSAAAPLQTQLAQLDAQAQQAGGYDKLAASAASQRDALRSRLATYESQLYLSYRNLALVLRDTGKFSEALDAAEHAQGYATDAEKPTTEALIQDLQQKLKP